MLCSIIIPCYNSTDTIEKCLASLVVLPRNDFEIILVDDCSSDSIDYLEKKFDLRIIKNHKNFGPSYSRNIGAQEASGDFVCFIDSDISIETSRILENLKLIMSSQEELVVTGGVDINSRYENFFSKYKNLYMFHTFSVQNEFVSFLYGSFVMMKKEILIPWPEDLRYGEDTFLGNELHQKGVKIFFDKKLQASHYKYFSFSTLLVNDFLVPFSFSKTFIRKYFKYDKPLTLKFSHAMKDQLLSISLVGLLIVLLIYSFFAPQLSLVWSYGALLTLWLFFNRSFFILLYKKENYFFFLRSVVFTFLDQAILGLGIFFGLIYYFFQFNIVKKQQLLYE